MRAFGTFCAAFRLLSHCEDGVCASEVLTRTHTCKSCIDYMQKLHYIHAKGAFVHIPEGLLDVHTYVHTIKIIITDRSYIHVYMHQDHTYIPANIHTNIHSY